MGLQVSAGILVIDDFILARTKGKGMEIPKTGEPTAEQRKLLLLLFQLVGATDIALGAGVAILGPGFVGGDPFIDRVLMIAGVFLAVGGIAMIWFGRHRYGAHQAEERSSPVFKVNG